MTVAALLAPAGSALLGGGFGQSVTRPVAVFVQDGGADVALADEAAGAATSRPTPPAPVAAAAGPAAATRGAASRAATSRAAAVRTVARRVVRMADSPRLVASIMGVLLRHVVH
jgi:hypothetical protein